VSFELLAWEPPEPGRAVPIDGGLCWLRLPVPGPLAHINVWLVPGRNGSVLVDTGMNHPDTHAAWEALGREQHLEDELEAILVTHHHPDHFGMSARLAERFGVPVRMSEPARAAALRNAAGPEALPEALLHEYRASFGVDFPALVRRAGGVGVFGRLVSGIPQPAPYLIEGEVPAEFADPWHASLHFGHAEGHVCLHQREAGLLISGDQLLPAISSNVSLYPGVGSSDPLADFLASLQRLGTLPAATIVLPAHGQPFRGAAERSAQLRAGHAQRLRKLTDFAAEPRATVDVVVALFGERNLEGWNSLLAYGETLAHIRYLWGRGELERLEEGGEVRWLRARRGSLNHPDLGDTDE